jgi:hypothetical protein
MIDLNEIEKAKLRRFWDDKDMREAVKKVLIAELREPANIFLGASDLSNEEIGSLLRATYEGIRALEIAYNTISQYQSLPIAKVVPNQAR